MNCNETKGKEEEGREEEVHVCAGGGAGTHLHDVGVRQVGHHEDLHERTMGSEWVGGEGKASKQQQAARCRVPLA